MKKPLLSELTLREKIGQTALGRPANEGYLDLEKYPYGSIWTLGNLEMGVINMSEEFGETVTNRDKWVESAKKFNKHLKVPLLHALDVGSTVPFHEYHKLLPAPVIGATDDVSLAYESGAVRAKVLKDFGTRWMWFQEVDLVNRQYSCMLGRLYSDDPEKVIKMATASMRGAQDNGVAATAKHFPGADGIEYRDAHVSDNMMLLPVDEWKKTQGRVFQSLFDAGIYSVMVAHGAFPFCDDTQRNGRYVPSTLSYKVVTELLKGEMGFKGVVITDGIEMNSALSYCYGDIKQVYVEAIKAGNDIVLGVRDEYFDAIEKAVESGEISMERIDDACQRVLDLKEKLGFFEDDFKEAEGTVQEANAAIDELNKKLSKNAVALVCDNNNLFPLKKENIKKVGIIYSGHDKTGSGKIWDSLEKIKPFFEERGAEVELIRSPKIHEECIETIKRFAEEKDLIIYSGFLGCWNPHGMASFFDDEFELFHHALKYGAEKTVGVGLGSPYMYFDFYSNFPTFVNLNSSNCYMLEAFVAAMYGDIGFEGKHNFKLIPPQVEHYLNMLKNKK